MVEFRYDLFWQRWIIILDKCGKWLLDFEKMVSCKGDDFNFGLCVFCFGCEDENGYEVFVICEGGQDDVFDWYFCVIENKYLVVFMDIDKLLLLGEGIVYDVCWLLGFGSYEVIVEMFSYEFLLLEFLVFNVVEVF